MEVALLNFIANVYRFKNVNGISRHFSFLFFNFFVFIKLYIDIQGFMYVKQGWYH